MSDTTSIPAPTPETPATAEVSTTTKTTTTTTTTGNAPPSSKINYVFILGVSAIVLVFAAGLAIGIFGTDVSRDFSLTPYNSTVRLTTK